MLPYGTTTQFSILSTICPILSFFLQARHFADIPCFFPKITFCDFLNPGYSRNIVARFLFGVSKGKCKFSGIVIWALLNIDTKSFFQCMYLWESRSHLYLQEPLHSYDSLDYPGKNILNFRIESKLCGSILMKSLINIDHRYHKVKKI